ncbi:glycosyl transferase [Rhizobium sp. NPDC090275]|uniref:O-linked N-acetylglucosamine transferase, SPINDLY family protein n=1 Tax=Rhizobium sp. NPDC090275 TaxID=3364498 RepID=UPI000DE0CF0A
MNHVVSFSAASKDFQSGNYVRSLATLNTLLETQQDAKTYALLGRTLVQLGMKGDAALAYALAGDKAGDSGAEFSRKAALLHFEAGNENEALRLGLRHMMNRSLDAEIAYVLASIYLKRGKDELLSPFSKVLAESSNIEHTLLAVRMLRTNPSDEAQAFLARSLFKRFPHHLRFRLLYLIFSRHISDLNAITLHKPLLDKLLAKGEREFLSYEGEFYNLQWCGNEEFNIQAGALGVLAPGQAAARRAAPHQWSQKIRVGYLSSDFFEQHATMKLIGRVLELHDRDRFDVTLYCHTNAKNLESNTFDRNRWGRIVEVRDLSNEEVAARMRADGIDVVIDLKGPTFETRCQILNHGCAPVQMSWIGFPGSTQGTDLDYVIGDRFVLPETSKPYYHEKFVHLPDTYQPNDPIGRPMPQPVSRAQYGLPFDKFVFASFNASRKLTPETVDVWCNILRRTPDSVLWIMAVSKASEANLRDYFKKQGIPAKRIIFAGHSDQYQDHINRQQVADLALDTWPYNGHTTTSEQLWGGLPVLTLKGTNFASRVSESLLNALGLPELVTADVKAYEDTAVELYNNPDRVAGFKQTIETNRLLKPLFDAERFCRHLETAYEMAVERAKQGLSPDHMAVPALPERTAPFPITAA